jgi:predicted TIM-barrel fold metal-dependent hydrolase
MNIIDSHVHIWGYNNGNLTEILEGIYKIKELMNLESINAAAIPAWDRASAGQNLICLLFKALYNDCRAYAGLEYYHDGVEETPDGFLGQLTGFMDMGFDGIKIIEYKPSSYKKIGYGMNTCRHRKFFAFLEKNKIPVLWHTADPEENWDADLCNDFARKSGWYYGEGGFPSKDELTGEAEAILDEFPGLNAVFAHMFFLTADISKARAFMQRHPGARLDVTPGTEMYFNFTKDREGWRNFFIDYQDRILFGTDNGWGDEASPAQKAIEGCEKIAFLDAFFSGDSTIRLWDKHLMRGLALPGKVLDKLYRDNFLAMAGERKTPKKVNLDAACAYAQSLYKHTGSMKEELPEMVQQIQKAREMLESLAKGRIHAL